jgi:phospholipase C
MSARDANAEDLGAVLLPTPRRPVPARAIPTSDMVLGPASDADAICSADSVQSVSPEPLESGAGPRGTVLLPDSGTPTGAGMVGLGRELRSNR